MDYLEENRGFAKLFSPSRWKLERDEKRRELRAQFFALLIMVVFLLIW